MQVDEREGEHPEALLVEGAIRGELQAAEQTLLDRHLATCAACAAELEAARLFDALLEPEPLDQARGRTAVDGALARLSRPQPRTSAGPRLLVPRTRVLALGIAAVAAILLVVPRARRSPPPRQASVTALPPAMLADGSEVVPEGPSSSVSIGEQTKARTIVHLTSGAARFRVRHDPARLFRVEVGPFEIQDLGTIFRVAQEKDGRVRVAVWEGRVAVACARERLRVEIGAGEERVFSAGPEAAADPPAESPRLAAPKAAAHAQPAPHAADEVSDLLLAADVARRSRKPEAALPLLRRIVDRHPGDPRAASAAFTLGWVLQMELARPAEAAAAFSEAERLARRGVLAEDAAARAAEAWRDAGDARRAVEAARHYEQVYPNGQSIASMRGIAGPK